MSKAAWIVQLQEDWIKIDVRRSHYVIDDRGRVSRPRAATTGPGPDRTTGDETEGMCIVLWVSVVLVRLASSKNDIIDGPAVIRVHNSNDEALGLFFNNATLQSTKERPIAGCLMFQCTEKSTCVSLDHIYFRL